MSSMDWIIKVPGLFKWMSFYFQLVISNFVNIPTSKMCFQI